MANEPGIAATQSSRPEVVPDERSQAFFDGCARGQLLIRKCTACQNWGAPTDLLCTLCGNAELEWAQASGLGVVHTFGIVHHVSHPGFRDEAPYNVAVVELEEGPRLDTRLVGCDHDTINVGMQVVVEFVRTSNDVCIPVFRPLA